MKTNDEIRAELEKFVPPSEILKRPGGGGKQLAYVDRFYVITTLNRIYGHDGWTTRLDVNLCGDRYVATCQLVVGGVTRSETGECLLDSHGKPNENAATEAATQAFKRAASQLGNAFGLHLYRGLEVAAAQPSSPPAQVAQAVAAPAVTTNATDPARYDVAATPQVVAGTLTKPDYQGAIQSAMANAEASAPPPVQQQQSGPQVDLERLAAARADVTVWKTRQGPRGIPMADIEEETLVWYAETYGKNIAEKPNPRYEESNRAHLANIKYCLQYFHVQDNQAQEHAQPQRQGESWPTDADSMDNSDIPF